MPGMIIWLRWNKVAVSAGERERGAHGGVTRREKVARICQNVKNMIGVR